MKNNILKKSVITYFESNSANLRNRDNSLKYTGKKYADNHSVNGDIDGIGNDDAQKICSPQNHIRSSIPAHRRDCLRMHMGAKQMRGEEAPSSSLGQTEPCGTTDGKNHGRL